MVVCPSCATVNADEGGSCLACGGSLTAAGVPATSPPASRCAAGHPVDPRWESCPYCANGPGADERQAGATRFEAPPLDATAVSASPGRRTELQPAHRSGESGGSGRPSGPADVRPLVGVLVAAEATPEGLLFPLRTGKNSIGSGAECDIGLLHDPRVSSLHALILHRAGSFYLQDRMSTNGTFLNGEEVEPSTGARLLADRDRLRCGGTELTLFTLESAAGAATS